MLSSCYASGRVCGWLLPFVCLIAAVGCNTAAEQSAAVPTAGAVPLEQSVANGTVVHVVDGDTLDVRLGSRIERIRLIGIDTPETKKPNTPIQCYGPEASARLSALLAEGTTVKVLRDAELRDAYGRLLAYTFRAEDNLFVNLTLVEEGFAVPLEIAPNTTFASDVSAASSAARRSHRGLWAACPERTAPVTQKSSSSQKSSGK